MIAGYATSIKELDMAKFEIEKLRFEKGLPPEGESDQSLNEDGNQLENGKPE